MAEILQQQDLMGKLTILSDAAKYDVACTSSGVERKGNGRDTGNTYGAGICHAFTSDGRCISLLKILFTNECIYDCRYCINRRSNDVPRASFTPDEVCRLTMEFYRRNYIEGLFLSSGIIHSPDYTMGLLYETLFLLRSKYRFNGYIHIKGIPGASADIVEMVIKPDLYLLVSKKGELIFVFRSMLKDENEFVKFLCSQKTKVWPIQKLRLKVLTRLAARK